MKKPLYYKQIVVAGLLFILLSLTYVSVTPMSVAQSSIHVKYLYDHCDKYGALFRYIEIDNETITISGFKYNITWRDYNNNTINVTGIHLRVLRVASDNNYTRRDPLAVLLNRTELAKFHTTKNESHILVISNYTGANFYEQIFITANNILNTTYSDTLINYTLDEINVRNATSITNPSRALYTVVEYMGEHGVDTGVFSVRLMFYIPGNFLNKTTLGKYNFAWYIMLENVTAASKDYTHIEEQWFFVSPEGNIILTDGKIVKIGYMSAGIPIFSGISLSTSLQFLLLSTVAIMALLGSLIIYRKKHSTVV